MDQYALWQILGISALVGLPLALLPSKLISGGRRVNRSIGGDENEAPVGTNFASGSLVGRLPGQANARSRSSAG
jgi:hypothetical protein